MLTNLQLKNIKPKDKPYLLSNGNGLFLRIMPNGSMKWIVKKSVKMQRIVKTLGSYPEMSIREARDEFAFLIDSLTQQKSYTALTFSDVYNEWLN